MKERSEGKAGRVKGGSEVKRKRGRKTDWKRGKNRKEDKKKKRLTKGRREK